MSSTQIIIAVLGLLAATTQATPFIKPLLKIAPVPVPVAVPIPVPAIAPPSPAVISLLLKPLVSLWRTIITPVPVIAPVAAPITLTPIPVDQVLQAKINLLLTPGAPVLSPLPPTAPELPPPPPPPPARVVAPVVVAATLTPPSAIPLASTKPFLPVEPEVEPEEEPSHPSVSASGSAHVLLSSYGVPASVSHNSPSAAVSFNAHQTLPTSDGPHRWSGAAAPADVDDDSHAVHAAVRVSVAGAPDAVHGTDRLHQVIEQQEDQYVSSYRLEDGTAVQEQGHFVPTGNGAEQQFVKQGHYEYRSPDGQTQRVRWVADQNGYRVLDK